MRNLLLVILISASSVWASDSYSQNTQLKLSATEGTIESIFNQISKQSRLEFFYNTNILNAKEKVSLSIKQGTLDEILKEILGERYSYTIKDRYILITKNKTESAEQNEVVVVKGVVRDMKGNVLPGVSDNGGFHRCKRRVFLKNSCSGEYQSGVFFYRHEK